MRVVASVAQRREHESQEDYERRIEARAAGAEMERAQADRAQHIQSFQLGRLAAHHDLRTRHGFDLLLTAFLAFTAGIVAAAAMTTVHFWPR